MRGYNSRGEQGFPLPALPLLVAVVALGASLRQAAAESVQGKIMIVGRREDDIRAT